MKIKLDKPAPTSPGWYWYHSTNLEFSGVVWVNRICDTDELDAYIYDYDKYYVLSQLKGFWSEELRPEL